MKENLSVAIRISIISIIVNVGLGIVKLLAGIFSSSGAMISDAIHTFSDVLSTVVVIGGISFSQKKSDKKHPYGHERFECIAAALLAVMLFLVGVGIGTEGIKVILNRNVIPIEPPKALAVIAALISIATKEWMYRYTNRAAIKTQSTSLKADAWHHRSDALSSIGSLIGIVGARMGFLLLDPMVSIVICIMIIKVSVTIGIDAVRKLIDQSCDEQIISQIQTLVLSQSKVKEIRKLMTRMIGSGFSVELSIAISSENSLEEAYQLSKQIEKTIQNQFPQAKHIFICAEPL